jgi:alpha-amylase/alpha-mannosidase (GH57 family)
MNYVCIHGHFYQPPRENPFTGEVEPQPSAAPWRDWNERINGECYTPNTAAPILGPDGEMIKTVNTYEMISFDFGPTLLSWLESKSPLTYRSIIEADAQAARRFGGFGSAMAQGYNHTILPLSNSRDKVTQVRWGIADFQERFGRFPAGMWLPETAVDTETLGILAAEGIKYTILSPFQAAAVREPGQEWVETEFGTVDTRIPYRVDLPGGHSIAVFFYNGHLSQEIAFNGLLEDGRVLARRLIESVGPPLDQALLAHVATDGETYGHHHRHGEMALAAALEEIDAHPEVTLTNYEAFLQTSPPAREARVVESSSWSCMHGVARWRSDCGCSTGQHPEWHQTWRGPLRDALDWLRDKMIQPFETHGARVFEDPWAVRDAYVSVVLGEAIDDFLREHARDQLDAGDRRMAAGLLEIQHHAMLMYTSCGWFFDDISGLEAIFVLRHAGRVLDLARQVIETDLESEFLRRLELAPSNVDGRDARDVFEAEVRPYMAAQNV